MLKWCPISGPLARRLREMVDVAVSVRLGNIS
jgi:hypothetical protein